MFYHCRQSLFGDACELRPAFNLDRVSSPLQLDTRRAWADEVIEPKRQRRRLVRLPCCVLEMNPARDCLPDLFVANADLYLNRARFLAYQFTRPEDTFLLMAGRRRRRSNETLTPSARR